MHLLFSGVAGVFIIMSLAALFHLRWVRRLPALGQLPANAEAARVRCSVVLAARNEGARVEQTIRHLFAQRGVDAEFIVVDDRSTDDTSEILRRLTKEDARLQVRRVDVLPQGWLGKCHACHLGASAATGDWILFTDADCWLTPDVISRAVRVAEHSGVDHVTLTSGISPNNLGLQSSHVAFLMSLANWISGVNRDQPKAHLGIGAFNLVRATAYWQCGGYEALRLTVLDDVKLGLLVRRAGKRTRAFLGGEDAECHWGSSVWSIVTLMEKNYFAALDFRLWLALLGSLFVIFLLCLVAFGLWSRTPAGIFAAISPFTLCVPAGILARRLGWSWPCALLVPFMFPLFLVALLNSAFITLRQGGVRWRDTFYSLEELRAGGVR